ncbi:MAG TPA: BrnT family toxin [Pyrinomonadaceae bacterium]|nr:BrnT family toxin [Pyrinomonadaceae bacterium]
MKFEWDDAKAQTNLAKHGVGFEEATEVFYDPNGLEDYDAEHSETESRFFIIGLSSRRLLYVIYAKRLGNVIRIISARKADQVEQQIYERTKNR